MIEVDYRDQSYSQYNINT